MTFLYDGVSIQNHRKSNMDSLLLKQRSIGGIPVCIAAVCDGIGGLADGAIASSAAVRELNQWFDAVKEPKRLGLQMRDAVLEIHRSIVKKAEQEGLRTGTTLSALLLEEDHYYVVHTGDSRIYMRMGCSLTQLTEDQSETGHLTACLGHGDRTALFYNEGSGGGDCFLLCSDGLYKRMSPVLLQQGVGQVTGRNIRKVMERFIQYVTERGEKDNISLALVLREE